MLAQRLPSDPAAAEPRGGDRGHPHPQHHRRLARRGTHRRRPFRAPHHTITTAGLVGGARRGWIGEVVLAHHGVLFLDELSEFARPALEALRQPLEDGRVAIVSAQHSAVYPARFTLVAATNPCPCGYLGDGDRCRCSEADLARHRRRLSGPLLDRIDLVAHLERPTGAHELHGAPPTHLREGPRAGDAGARAPGRDGCARRACASTRTWTLACCAGTSRSTARRAAAARACATGAC